MKAIILWFMKAIVLLPGSYCPEVIIHGRGIFIDTQECLTVSTGGFNTQWIPGAYKSLMIETCTLDVFHVHSVSLNRNGWL